MRDTSDPKAARNRTATRPDPVSAGEFLLAATAVRRAASGPRPSVRPIATFDAALCWLAERNFDALPRASCKAFSALQPGSPLQPELLLEEGMAQARDCGLRKPARASKTSSASFPKNHGAAEARLALAELALFPSDGRVASAADRSEAARSLRLVSAAAPPAESARKRSTWVSGSRHAGAARSSRDVSGWPALF